MYIPQGLWEGPQTLPRLPHPEIGRSGRSMGSHASLTLGFQLGQDGLGPTDRSSREGLHPLLGRVADSLDVGVALLGGRVGSRHHVAGGADEGHASHAVHHAGLRAGRLRPGTWLASPSLCTHSVAQARHSLVPPSASSILARHPTCLNMTLTPTVCQAVTRHENSTVLELRSKTDLSELCPPSHPQGQPTTCFSFYLFFS